MNERSGEDENTLSNSVFRLTKKGLKIYLKPAEETDKLSVREFLDALSTKSLYRRFFTMGKNTCEEFLCDFFTPRKNEYKLLALSEHNNSFVTGIGQYYVHSDTRWGEAGIIVSDVNQDRGIGRLLLTHMTETAKCIGLVGLEGLVQMENRPMLHLCYAAASVILKEYLGQGVYRLRIYL